MEFTDLKYLLFSKILLSGIGGYPPPPLNGKSSCPKTLSGKGGYNFIFTLIGRLPNCPERVSPTSPGESCCFNCLDQWSIFETYDDHTWPYLRRTLIMLCCADPTLRLVGGLGNATKEVSTKLLNVQNHISSFFGQNTHKEERKHKQNQKDRKGTAGTKKGQRRKVGEKSKKSLSF